MAGICGIYKIQSKVHTDRCYIGSSYDIKNRWRTHKPETIEKMSQDRLGKPHGHKTNNGMKLKQKPRPPQTEEHKKNVSIAIKKWWDDRKSNSLELLNIKTDSNAI